MTAARPQRRAVVDEVDLDGEIVVFDGYEVHHLAGPAAAVWRLADGTLSVEQIAAVLAEGYRARSGRGAAAHPRRHPGAAPARPCQLNWGQDSVGQAGPPPVGWETCQSSAPDLPTA